MVNAQVLQGHWDQVKGAIREKWGQVTDNDLQRVNGNMEQLVGVIERKTGEARSKVEAFLEETLQDSESLLERGKDAIRTGSEQAAAAVKEQYENVADHMKTGYQEAEAVVRHRPAESVAVAFGAGLISGVVAALMLRSR